MQASITDNIRRKAIMLRSIYGGAMSLKEVQAEIGHGYAVTKAWVEENHLGRRIGKRTTYDTDAVARVLVMELEFGK